MNLVMIKRRVLVIKLFLLIREMVRMNLPAGELHLFNPSSTTYVKNWYAQTIGYAQSDMLQDFFIAGYYNTTTAINAVSFKFSSGNFDGKIKMFGIK